MQIRRRARILALGALALFTVVSVSAPRVASAAMPECLPSCGNGPVLDCYINGKWYAAGTVVRDLSGQQYWCNGYTGHFDQIGPEVVGLGSSSPSIQAGPSAGIRP
jgi:hypothetical protein